MIVLYILLLNTKFAAMFICNQDKSFFFNVLIGVNRGKCEKCESVAECKCINGWSLDDRGVCSCSNSLCTQNSSSSPCNEKGFCNCDRCVCNSQVNIYV